MTSNQLIDHNYVKFGQLYRLYQNTEDFVKISEFKAIIENTIDINYKLLFDTFFCQNNPEYLGNTALHFFATFSDYNDYEDSSLQLLLELGANLFITNNKGYTPLLLAFYNDYRVVLLLQAQFKLKNSTNSRSEDGISHFHVACSVSESDLCEIVEIVDFFLKSGASVNERVNDDSPVYPGYTPLHFAAESAEVQIIDLLLNNGADINSKNAEGFTPLHILMKKDNLKKDMIQKYLMRAVCNNQYDEDLWLLRLESIFQGNSSKDHLNQDVHMDFFIELNSKIYPGYTPLHLATHLNLKIVMSLLLQGANLLAKDAKGITPLDLCLKKFTLSNIVDILKIEKQHQLSKLKFTNGMYLLDVLEAMTTPDKFKQFLSSKISNVNTFIPFQSLIWPGFNLLHLGVLFNCYVSELLNHKADFTMINKDGSSPLHLAFCMGKDKDVVKILKAHNQLLTNPVNWDNLSHLHIACAAGDIELTKLLLHKGANPNLPTLQDFQWYPRHPKFETIHSKTGSTPLHIAVKRKKNCDLMKILLNYNANPHIANADGETPFYDALNNYRYSEDKELLIPILTQMLEINSESWATEAMKIKILRLALSSSDKPDLIVQRLVHEFDKNGRYEDLGLTRLQVACCIGDLTMVQEELKSVVDINGSINLDLNFYIRPGDTAMHILFQQNPKQTNEIAELLFAHGADPTLKNSKNVTPIHVCTEEALHTAISLLSNKFTGVNPTDNEGISHFHLACKTSNVLVVKEFLESGVDINMTVDYFADYHAGWTPLHFAMCYGGEDVVELLLNHGADPKIMNADGLPPLHQAVSLNCDINTRNRVEKILRHPTINIQDTSIFGDSILMLAFQSYKLNDNIVDLLLDTGVYINLSWFTTENLNTHDLIFKMASTFSPEIFKRMIGLIPALLTTDDEGRNALNHIGLRLKCQISNISYYKKNIEMLLESGYELDQKDNEGFTILHYAIAFCNMETSTLLLSLGADLNMKSDDGRTPVHFAFNSSNSVLQLLVAQHVQKLKEVGLYIEESNETYLEYYEDDELPYIIKSEMDVLNYFLKEEISLSFNADYFFTEQFVIDYKRIQSSRRQTILKFWKSHDLHELFPNLVSLLNRQLRKARTRTRLLEPAKVAITEFINFILPDLCLDFIFNYLSIEDMMNLIRAKNGKLEFAPLPKNC